MLFGKRQVNNCDYIAFDLETTGLNQKPAEIIEIAAIKVINTEIVDTLSVLVKPQYGLKGEAQIVNRITQADLASALQPDKAIKLFLNFIGNNKLIGYNCTSFDLPILRKYSVFFNNPVDDVLYMARRKIFYLINYKIENVAAYLNVPFTGSHRALVDCRIIKDCYEKLIYMPDAEKDLDRKGKKYQTKHTDETRALQNLQSLISGIISDGIITREEIDFLTKWLVENKWLSGNFPFDVIFGTVRRILADGVIDSEEREYLMNLFSQFSISEPLKELNSIEKIYFEGRNFVLTGEFNLGDKMLVQKFIECRGGVCKTSVSSKTNYVIVGGKGSPDWGFGNFGVKIKRAKELNSEGHRIVIVSESDFFKNIH